MEKLRHHLIYFLHDQQFEPSEWNNALRFLYTALGGAIYDNAQTVRILRNGFEWFSDGQLIGRHLGGIAPEPSPSYQTLFRLILLRDETVRRYATIMSETPDEMLVKFSER